LRTPAPSRRFQSPALKSAALSTLVHLRLRLEAAWSQLPARSSSVRVTRDLKNFRLALPCSVCHGRRSRAHRPPLHRYSRPLRTAFVRPCRPVV